MDVVRFVRHAANALTTDVVDIYVNDIQLAKLIEPVEKQFADTEALAGRYTGLPRFQFRSSLSYHFLGFAGSDPYEPRHKTVLLVCYCGEPGCGRLMACVDVVSDTVTWSDFEQPDRQDRRYGDLRFTFDRGQYYAALGAIER